MESPGQITPPRNTRFSSTTLNVVAVPNLQHYRYAKVALEAGKHVIVEKPMACTAAQTEELAALARR
ncbi:Gfo/Idh/MocA family oxidoreductase, partial [Faecalibacterium duncaniae]|uniref:Gfo/Idh/MocA family oxidoreductase n=1 Tax=Faecalibacterium duncaniae (strain DSM 17677 / JCM 31915 / A2-165) TaxID=411483 RepID=UPI0029401E9B